jgi:GT2 family glycosyltransferase
VKNLSPKISVIIPCFNGWKYTKECLSSVFLSNYSNYNVILVNDGSTDETSLSLEKDFPQVIELLGDGNLWWSGSMNLGFKEARRLYSEYVLVLNNDVVVEPNTISNLVETASENPKCIVGCLIYNLVNPKMIWSAGGNMKWPWPGEIQIGIGEFDCNQYSGVRIVEWSPGMGTLIDMNILIDVNFYDDLNMPQYLSDVDLCLRAKNKGYSVLINSECKLYNNLDNTGGISSSFFRFNIQSIKDIFFSFRSPDYFRARLMFIFRHCSWNFLIFALLYRYFRLFIFILKRLV